MFLEGMRKPWWMAAFVVWLVVLIGLQEYRGMDFQAAARIGVIAGGLVALVVWFAVVAVLTYVVYRRVRITAPEAA